MRILVFILLFLSISQTSFGQSAWTHPKGEGYFKIGQSFLQAGDFFNLQGDIIEITTTSVYITSLYGEYGFSKRLTGQVYFPFFVRSTLNKRESTVNGVVEPGDEINGIGDPMLGLKYGLITQGPFILAVDAMIGIPLGENVGGETELLQTGDGEFNQMIRLIGSTSFSKGKGYGSLYVGFNNRTKADFEFSAGIMEDVEFSDEFHWGGEIGWIPSKSWLLALKWAQVIALDNGNPGMNTSSLFGNNVEYFSFTPEVGFLITENFGASLAVGAALSGQNILAAPNWGIGVFYQLK